MKVLITGSTGLLGPYLMDAFKIDPENNVIGMARGAGADFECDLTNPADLHRFSEGGKPDLVIHAAAATDVDWCQKNPQEAYSANVVATRNLVQFMPPDSKLVYISTDMVYAGPGPHAVRGATVSPLNVYGMTKFMGELEAEKHPHHLIVRTNIYGRAKTPRASSLVDFLIASLQKKNPIGIYTDIIFSPLHVTTLASRIKMMLDKGVKGTINLGSRNGVSKAKFALLLASNLGLSTEVVMPVEAPTTGRAPRPKDTRMLTDWDAPLLEEDLAQACRSWQI